MWSRAFFILVSASLPITGAYGKVSCNEVLKHGIYDFDNKFDLKEQYKIARWSYCEDKVIRDDYNASGGYGIYYGNLGLSQNEAKKFCEGKFDKEESRNLAISTTKKINSHIIKAWSECKKQHSSSANLFHYIKPSSYDEGIFFYKIEFNRGDSNDYPRILDFSVINAECNRDIKKGTKIKFSGLNLTCKLDDHEKNAIINVNADKYARFIDPIEFPALSLIKRDIINNCITLRSADPENKTCNSKTDDGYYWKLVEKRKHYPVHSFLPNVSEQSHEVPCNKDNLGKTGISWRWPMDQEYYQPVRNDWITTTPNQFTLDECNLNGGTGEKREGQNFFDTCGKFLFVCTAEGQW